MRVLLIGDSCTDVYVYGDVKRLNPEHQFLFLNLRDKILQEEWHGMYIII